MSCPQTSKQNSLVERCHQQIFETELTLLAQASLSISYWDDAFATTVHIMNVLPTKVLHGVYPHEQLFCHKPDYRQLCIFGCLCYPLLRPYNRHKLQYRSAPCTFLGYASNHKGYKCISRSRHVYISRHVCFDENEFPFAQVSPSVVSVTDNKSGRYTRAITTLPVFKVPTAEISAQSRADSSPASDTSALDSSSNGVLGYTSISPIGTLTPIVEQQRPTSVNCHPMMTRSKMGFYKPKAYMVMISNVEP